MTDSFKDMATRITLAEGKFIAYAMEHAGLSRAEAVKALGALKRLKVLKIDVGVGQWRVTHGAYLEPDVLRRAAGRPEPEGK